MPFDSSVAQDCNTRSGWAQIRCSWSKPRQVGEGGLTWIGAPVGVNVDDERGSCGSGESEWGDRREQSVGWAVKREGGQAMPPWLVWSERTESERIRLDLHKGTPIWQSVRFGSVALAGR